MPSNYEQENPTPKLENDARVRQQVRQRKEFFISLASTFRTELTNDMCAIYLAAMMKVNEYLLRKAVTLGLKQWKFFPSVAEIWEQIAIAQSDPIGHDRGYERLKQRIATQKEVLALKSVLDDISPIKAADITQLKSIDLEHMTPEEKKRWAHHMAVKNGWLHA